MSAQHTPGPWTYEIRVMSLYVVRDANCKQVCAVMPDVAPLIAAAPDLLQAAAALLAHTPRCFALTESEERTKVSLMDAMRAAIAKATGSAS